MHSTAAEIADHMPKLEINILKANFLNLLHLTPDLNFIFRFKMHLTYAQLCIISDVSWGLNGFGTFDIRSSRPAGPSDRFYLYKTTR